jgi:hypothetical protein
LLAQEWSVPRPKHPDACGDVSVTQNFSTADAMGRLTLNMLMSFAQFEAEMIAERTRDKLALARQKGKWTGGPVPFGYSTQDKRLVVNEQEALVVREVFELFLQHQGMAIVARKLNERRLLPRDVGRTPKHGIRWSKDAVSRLLHNPIYIGKMMYCNTVYPGEHPALVDEATFRRAQRILEGGSRELRFAGGNPDYVLRGLLFCGACGGAMTPASTRRGKKQWRYYRCAGRDKHGGAVCRAKPLAADAIESFVVQRVAAVTQDGALAAEVKARLTARLESRTAELEMLQRVLPDRIADASTKVSRYADEMLKFEGRAREAIEAKLCAASELLAADERQLATVQRDMIDLRDATIEAEWIVGALAHFASIWDAMTPENRGRLLRALVASVRVHEGKVDIEFVDFAGDSETAQVEAGPKEAA